MNKFNIWKENLRAKLQERARKVFLTTGEYVFFRCLGCHKILVHKDFIKIGCCHKCGHTRKSPTNLSFWENNYYLVRLLIGK